MRDSDDHKDQGNYWETKKRNNLNLLNAMNAAIKADPDLGEDPRKLNTLNSNFKLIILVEGDT